MLGRRILRRGSCVLETKFHSVLTRVFNAGSQDFAEKLPLLCTNYMAALTLTEKLSSVQNKSAKEVFLAAQGRATELLGNKKSLNFVDFAFTLSCFVIRLCRIVEG